MAGFEVSTEDEEELAHWTKVLAGHGSLRGFRNQQVLSSIPSAGSISLNTLQRL